MRYCGSKRRISAEISDIIISRENLHNEDHKKQVKIIEPFCGGLNFTKTFCEKLSKIENLEIDYIASDCDSDLISLYENLIANSKFPSPIANKEEYLKFKNSPNPSFEKSFAAFCSFQFRKWGGFISTNDGRNYYKEFANGLEKDRKFLQNPNPKIKFKLANCNYNEFENWENAIFYLDPPYFQTATEKTWKFNHDEFWNFCRKISLKNSVYVSELSAPRDFKPIWEKSISCGLSHEKKMTEKLFQYSP